MLCGLIFCHCYLKKVRVLISHQRKASNNFKVQESLGEFLGNLGINTVSGASRVMVLLP